MDMDTQLCICAQVLCDMPAFRTFLPGRDRAQQCWWDRTPHPSTTQTSVCTCGQGKAEENGHMHTVYYRYAPGRKEAF